jgi:N-acetylneuraminic acid mutarotase
MKQKLLCLIVLLCSAGATTSAQIWSTGTAIPLPIRGGNGTGYSKDGNGYLFIVSGRKTNGAIVKTVQRYNVNTNTWDTLMPPPDGSLGAGITILKDSLYLVGGVINPPGFGETTVYKYSISENTWSEVADYPYAVADAKAVGYKDSLIYTAGGIGGPDSGNVYLYNAHTNSWRPATPLPIAGRINFGGFAITGDTLVYVCGTEGLFSPNYFNKVYTGSINPTDKAQISWTEGTPFPGNTRSFFDAHTWGKGSIILSGGSTDNTFDTPSDECYVYTPATGIWTAQPSKPTPWLTGQSGSVQLPGGIWKLICASGFNTSYLPGNEIFSETQNPTAIPDSGKKNDACCLFQNSPNPFRNTTTITYEVKQAGILSLQIRSLSGSVAQNIPDKKHQPGKYNICFNRHVLPSGIYYYTLFQGEAKQTRAMVITD